MLLVPVEALCGVHAEPELDVEGGEGVGGEAYAEGHGELGGEGEEEVLFVGDAGCAVPLDIVELVALVCGFA